MKKKKQLQGQVMQSKNKRQPKPPSVMENLHEIIAVAVDKSPQVRAARQR